MIHSTVVSPTPTPELVVPAGSLEKLRYALAYGADSVYAGTPLFSLRARENEFTVDELKRAISYVHERRKKIFIAMNIYAHNSRVERFLDSFCELQEFSPDGFIMTDGGLIRKALRLRPNTRIHLSTQANATNWTTLEMWQDLGVSRIILPRELSIKEIAEMHHHVPKLELEAFVHGSICIAYSGRCLISNYLNHRDANDGTCTNSCRWEYALAVEQGSLAAAEGRKISDTPYEPLLGNYVMIEPHRSTAGDGVFEVDEDTHGTYLMNSKDLCGIELLSDLAAAGVMGFKIEGRSKSLYYLATVTKAYRQAINDMKAGKSFNPQLLRDVAATSNRTLMTGFLVKRPKEYGENREDGRSSPLSHQFSGVALKLGADRSTAYVEFKNRVRLGDEVEWLTPDGVYPSQIQNLTSSRGEALSEASGGVCGTINIPPEIGEFALLRQALVPQEQFVATPAT